MKAWLRKILGIDEELKTIVAYINSTAAELDRSIQAPKDRIEEIGRNVTLILAEMEDKDFFRKTDLEGLARLEEENETRKAETKFLSRKLDMLTNGGPK